MIYMVPQLLTQRWFGRLNCDIEGMKSERIVIDAGGNGKDIFLQHRRRLFLAATQHFLLLNDLLIQSNSNRRYIQQINAI